MNRNTPQPNYMPVALWAAGFVREWNARPALLRWLLTRLLGSRGCVELFGLMGALRSAGLDPGGDSWADPFLLR